MTEASLLFNHVYLFFHSLTSSSLTFNPTPLSSTSHFSTPAMHDNLTVSVGWQKEPGTRGTFTIVWIPLLTLFACVWTATHLNLPRHHELVQLWAWRKQLRRRTYWFIVGVFFPEAVAWCALRQFKEARKLDKFVQNLLHEERVRADDYLLKSLWRRAIRIFLPGRIDKYNKRKDLEVSFLLSSYS